MPLTPQELARVTSIVTETLEKEFGEKPWTPRFKVGDRVKLRNPIYPRQGEPARITAVMNERGRYRISLCDYTTWPEEALESSPFVLSRSLPNFRQLRDGEEWHRQDLTEEMLPEGWRPLLSGERIALGDEYGGRNGYWDVVEGGLSGDLPENFPKNHWRTRRPLSDPEREELVPLEAKDVPPGSVMRSTKWESWRMITGVAANGITRLAGSGDFFQTFEELAGDACWQILRPGQTDWQPCSKPASRRS